MLRVRNAQIFSRPGWEPKSLVMEEPQAVASQVLYPSSMEHERGAFYRGYILPAAHSITHLMLRSVSKKCQDLSTKMERKRKKEMQERKKYRLVW